VPATAVRTISSFFMVVFLDGGSGYGAQVPQVLKAIVHVAAIEPV
jgi:hypothetical protein